MMDQAYSDFKSLVNMTSKELEKWLQTDESQSVGIAKGTSSHKKTDADGAESIGHESGRKILDIMSKKEGALTDDDLAHIKKVNAYIKRHKAQRPAKEDIEHSRWRYSLMNWGYDPSKE